MVVFKSSFFSLFTSRQEKNATMEKIKAPHSLARAAGHPLMTDCLDIAKVQQGVPVLLIHLRREGPEGTRDTQMDEESEKHFKKRERETEKPA